MFVECIIANVLTEVKTVLPEFDYLPKEYWSPATEYDDRLLSYVVKLDKEQQLEFKNWIGMVWTITGPLETPSTGQAKAFTLKNIDIPNLIGDKYDFIQKTASFDIGIFSNDPYTAIKFMEYWSLFYDRERTIDILYPEPYKSLGMFSQPLFDVLPGEFTKLDRDTRGSLTKFGWSFKTNVPILRLKETQAIIGSYPDIYDPLIIHAKINVNQNIPQSVIDNLDPCFIII